MISVKTVPPRDVVTCAFCGGKGTDPFNCLSSRSVCASCHGRGMVEVAAPSRRCAYCQGSGSHKTFRCPICGGAGAVPEPTAPQKTCPDCDGRAFDGSSGLPCLTCRGLGTVPL